MNSGDNQAERDWEQALHAMNEERPGDLVRERVWRELETLHVRRHPWRFVFSLAVCAAVALTVWLGYFLTRQQTRVDLGTHPALSVISAREEVFIVETRPEKQTAIVQYFSDFKRKQVKPGDMIGAHTLQVIAADRLTLSSASGPSISYDIKAHNQAAISRLSQEVAALQSCVAIHAVTDATLERLNQIAYYGWPEAMQLLQTIASSPSTTGLRAQSMFAFNRQVQAIHTSADWARHGARDSRLKAIRALGKVDSPLALQVLHDLADDADDMEKGFARLCVESLAQQKERALPQLQDLAAKAKQEATRVAAQAQVDGIMKDMQLHD